MGKQILVVGGGAAGMMAAGTAAALGGDVMLLEKNQQLGKKVLLTGNGRCNLTNVTGVDGLIAGFARNGHFLYSAFSVFSNRDLIDFFDRLGVPTKVEPGGRVFPVSDCAADIVLALEKYLVAYGCKVKYGHRVEEIIVKDNAVIGVRLQNGEQIRADRVVLAAGGCSYPGTGSTGDGYRMAAKIGHTVVPLKPALVPLEVAEHWVHELQGLSLKNVKITARQDGEKLCEGCGEMLFTHFGISGPLVLTLSGKISERLGTEEKPVMVALNLRPELTSGQLEVLVSRHLQTQVRKQLKNALGGLLPPKLVPTIIRLAKIPGDKFIHQLTKEERNNLCMLLREMVMTVTKTRPLAEAMVTAGGISTKEVNPKTMASKKIKGLFFCGEVIDINGCTGGFNLQAAFSTGYLAGKNACLVD